MNVSYSGKFSRSAWSRFRERLDFDTENVVCMTYENGEKLIFNKNKTVFEYENKEIAPYSFVRIKSV
jgi:hypothetical protein